MPDVGQSQFVYRIIGADGKQYGPVPVEELRKWVAEGRATAATLAAAEGSTEWKSLGSLPEFSLWFTTSPQQRVPPPPVSTGLPSGRKTNGFAISSLVMGIVSVTVALCCYGFPFNLLGVIFGVIALSQIRNAPQQYDGEGMAIAGLVLSGLSLVLAAMLFVFMGMNATWGMYRHHMHRW